MQQKKNPLLVVLAVCGGCVLIGIIVMVVGGIYVGNKTKPFVNGMMNMGFNMPKFLADIKSKNYGGASALIDPSVQDKYTADKIQKMEEAVEKKLGPLQSFPSQFTSQNQKQNSDVTKPGQMPEMEFEYTYTLTYQKGTATATFKFDNKDVLKPTGLITGFTLEPNAPEKPGSD